MLVEDLETDFLKTALPRGAHWFANPRQMITDLFKPGVRTGT